ncbi:MAG: hypothetical protein WD492_06630 [Alkalispirochaeta sp.]
MTATEFRQELYKVLAELAVSGGSAKITHRGRAFYVIPEADPPLMERLIPHDTLRVEPEEIITDGASEWEWNEDRNLDSLP